MFFIVAVVFKNIQTLLHTHYSAILVRTSPTLNLVRNMVLLWLSWGRQCSQLIKCWQIRHVCKHVIAHTHKAFLFFIVKLCNYSQKTSLFFAAAAWKIALLIFTRARLGWQHVWIQPAPFAANILIVEERHLPPRGTLVFLWGQKARGPFSDLQLYLRTATCIPPHPDLPQCPQI